MSGRHDLVDVLFERDGKRQSARADQGFLYDEMIENENLAMKDEEGGATKDEETPILTSTMSTPNCEED